MQNRGGSEYLFLMWFRNGRRFWFYDQYVVFVAQSEAFPESTRQRFDLAFQRWESATGDVVFSGPWGWFDPATSRFEEDFPQMGPEDWERG